MPTSCSWTILCSFLAGDTVTMYDTLLDVGPSKRRNTQEHTFSTDCDVRNLPDPYMCLTWKLESGSLNCRTKGSDSKLWGHVLLCGWWQWSSDTVGNPAEVTILCLNNMLHEVITTGSCNAEVSNRLLCYTLMIDHHIYSDWSINWFCVVMSYSLHSCNPSKFDHQLGTVLQLFLVTNVCRRRQFCRHLLSSLLLTVSLACNVFYLSWLICIGVFLTFRALKF